MSKPGFIDIRLEIGPTSGSNTVRNLPKTVRNLHKIVRFNAKNGALFSQQRTVRKMVIRPGLETAKQCSMPYAGNVLTSLT
jgi:hypothetical protein